MWNSHWKKKSETQGKPPNKSVRTRNGGFNAIDGAVEIMLKWDEIIILNMPLNQYPEGHS